MPGIAIAGAGFGGIGTGIALMAGACVALIAMGGAT